MNSKLNVTFGTDPEFMLLDTQQNRIVSAIPVLGHDKGDPIDLGDGYVMYYDNVLVEMRIPPARSKPEMLVALQTAFLRAQDYLEDQYRLVPIASHIFDERDLGPKPEVMKGELPVEWEIGCNPSYNVYSRTQSIPAPFTDGLRTGSFHIHLGNADYKRKDRSSKLISIESKEDAIRLLDIYLGCSSVIFDRDTSAPVRRKLYGKAGEFRPTPYGIEYRVLSNFALRNPICTGLVLDLVEFVVNLMRDNRELAIIKAVDENLVKKAINSSDTRLAARVLESAKLPSPLFEAIFNNYHADFNEAWGLPAGGVIAR